MKYIIEKLVNHTKIIRINNTAKRNALSYSVLQELNSSLKEGDLNSDVKSMIITGSPDYFASGGNILEYMDCSVGSCIRNSTLEAFDYILSIKKPIVGGVNGYALGGGFQLALRCDMMVAGINTIFGNPELGIATIPGVGGTQILGKMVKRSRAMEMILGGRILSAVEARQFGIVSKVVSNNAVLDTCLELCNKINKHANAVLVKRSISEIYN